MVRSTAEGRASRTMGRECTSFETLAITARCGAPQDAAEQAQCKRPLPRPDQADRLVALEQVEQHAQRLAALAGQLRIAIEHQRGVVARGLQQLSVRLDARD